MKWKTVKEDRRPAEMLEVTGTPAFIYEFGAHVGYLEMEGLLGLLRSSR